MPEDPQKHRPFKQSTLSSSIIQRLRIKDQEAWDTFCQLYTPFFNYWLQRWQVPKDDRPDLIQEALTRVSSNIDRFDRSSRGGTFRGWLRVIIHNLTRTYYSSKKKRLERFGAMQAFEDYMVEVHDQPDQGEAQVLYNEALRIISNEFNKSTLEVFTEVFQNERHPKDVAKDFGLTVGSVYQIKYRVTKRLRERLQDLIE